MELGDGLRHALEGGGHQGGQAHQGGLIFPGGLHHGGGVHVPAQVNDRVAVVFQQHLHDVLADVVDVPLDGGQHHGAPAHRPPVLLGQGVPDHLKGGLGGPGGLDELGEEDLVLLKVGPHPVQGGDEDVVHNVHGLPGLQEGLGGGARLPLQAGEDDLGEITLSAGGRGGGGCSGGGDGGGHLGAAVGGDELPGVLVHVGEQVVAPHRRHHGLHIGVEDGQVQPGGHGHGEEILVDEGPGGQAEGDVGHPQHRLEAQLSLHPAQALQGLHRPLRLGGDGEGEAVDVHVLFPQPKGQGPVQDPLGNVHAGLDGLGDAPLVQGEAHHRRPVLLHQGQDGVQNGVLAVHRVDDGLAAVDA